MGLHLDCLPDLDLASVDAGGANKAAHALTTVDIFDQCPWQDDSRLSEDRETQRDVRLRSCVCENCPTSLSDGRLSRQGSMRDHRCQVEPSGPGAFDIAQDTHRCAADVDPVIVWPSEPFDAFLQDDS